MDLKYSFFFLTTVTDMMKPTKLYFFVNSSALTTYLFNKLLVTGQSPCKFRLSESEPKTDGRSQDGYDLCKV
jgi:hypothetical protein